MSSRINSMSVPFTTSAFTGEAPTSWSYSLTGRRLAKRPSPLRMASSPCSGRTLALGSSYLGSPTAPSRMASQALALSTTSGRSGTPWASMEAPPISSTSKENSMR